MIQSIRGRLLLGTVVSTLTIVLSAGAILYSLTRNRLWQSFDEALTMKARSLASILEQENGRLQFDIDYRVLPEFSHVDRPEYLQIWRKTGKVVYRSRSLKGRNLKPPDHASSPVDLVPVALPDGRNGRAVILEVVARDGSSRNTATLPAGAEIRIMVAMATTDLERELGELRRLLILVGLLAIVVISGVLIAVVWRGLTPLRRLVDQIAGLRPDNLSNRISLPKAPAELLPVEAVCNRLLERLETAMDRERSFTADVAHELRTPLSGFRSILEVSSTHEREPQAYQAAMTECLHIATQMQAMTNNLLALARLERGQISIDQKPVALEPLLRECWQPLAERAEEKSLQVHWATEPGVIVETDREILHQVLTNVLDNSVIYVNNGGEIRITAGVEDGTAQVCVSNTGSLISREEAERVFERFWRGDASRRNAGLHAGLGLSLARRLVILLGGGIEATSQHGGLFITILRLPASNGEHPCHRAGLKPVDL